MNVEEPKVSVIVPTMRRDAYLKEALLSVLAQSYCDFEVIVSDDGDEESTKALVHSFGDRRFRYRCNERRLGMFENNRIAFAEARGSYIANLHDDDRWHPTFLSKLTKVLEENQDALVAFCDHNIMSEDGTVNEDSTKCNSLRWGRADLRRGLHKPFYNLVIQQTIPAVMGAIFRREAIHWSEFPAVAGPAYDLWLTFLLANGGGGAYFVDERLTDYRVHGASQTGTGGMLWSLGAGACWERIGADPAYIKWRRNARSHAALSYRSAAKIAILKGDTSTFRSCLRRAWFFHPTASTLILAAVACLPNSVVHGIFQLKRSLANSHFYELSKR